MDGPLPDDLVPAWERFFAAGLPCLSLDGACDAVFADGVIFPLQRKRETGKMLRLAASILPRVVCEIGCDKGAGLLHWCLIPTVNRVIGCEIRGTPYWREFERAFPHIEFLWLPQSSYAPETVAQVRDWLDGDTIDTLFLDGDKSAYLKDFDAYLPLMRKDGIVFFHDVNDSTPAKAYHAVCRRGYPHREIIDRSEGKEAAERRKCGVPIDSCYEGWLRHWEGRSCGVGVVWLGEK